MIGRLLLGSLIYPVGGPTPAGCGRLGQLRVLLLQRPLHKELQVEEHLVGRHQVGDVLRGGQFSQGDYLGRQGGSGGWPATHLVTENAFDALEAEARDGLAIFHVPRSRLWGGGDWVSWGETLLQGEIVFVCADPDYCRCLSIGHWL